MEYNIKVDLQKWNVEARTGLSWTFRNGMWRHGLDYGGSDQEQVAGCCGCGDELSGSIKCGEFLD
jgi:hypothetical protein